jgi:methionyl-tRNA synthetase
MVVLIGWEIFLNLIISRSTPPIQIYVNGYFTYDDTRISMSLPLQ